jgi:hypothetical protein
MHNLDRDIGTIDGWDASRTCPSRLDRPTHDAEAVESTRQNLFLLRGSYQHLRTVLS